MKNPMSDSPVPKADSPTYVTRAEFDALTAVIGIALARVQLAHNRSGYADGKISAQLEIAERTPGMSAAERAALEGIIKALDRAMDQQFSAERRSEQNRGNAYYRVGG